MVPARLLQRLDDLGRHLSGRPDALALIGVGSCGTEVHRLDEYSDLDFFVIVEEQAKPAYVASIDWLAAPAPVAFSFANTPDGRKALYEDGVFVEYAVFTPAELGTAAFTRPRVVWQRPGSPQLAAAPPQRPVDVGREVREALTNLYIGLGREARGERLSASRFIQGHAVDRILTIVAAHHESRDPYDPSRRAEANTGGELPLAAMVPGYEANRAAAAVILDWLTARYDLDAAMVRQVRVRL